MKLTAPPLGGLGMLDVFGSSGTGPTLSIDFTLYVTLTADFALCVTTEFDATLTVLSVI